MTITEKQPLVRTAPSEKASHASSLPQFFDRVCASVLDTLCQIWHNPTVLDLNDLKVFESVGSLRSFAGAARALSLPRSSVSRCVARLEQSLGTRLINRTTREVELTPAGESLMIRSARALAELDQALVYIGGLATEAHGELRVSVGIGFGINVIADQLPEFLQRYPHVDVVLDLTSRVAELVSERVDVAIRLGDSPDSSMITVRVGEMKRLLCASPAYLERRGAPQDLEDLKAHDIIEMPRPDGRARIWSFTRGSKTREITLKTRASVNDALTINQMVLNGAGIGIISCYLCAPEIRAGHLVHLFPEWKSPAVSVNMIFPSRRELAPAVRAFVDFVKEANPPTVHWRDDDLSVRT